MSARVRNEAVEASTTPDWEAVRRDFPTTNSFVYLDSARKAPLPSGAEATMRAWMADIYERAGEDAFSMDHVEETRRIVARLVGAPPGTIALIKNTSEGINILARGLNLAAGDNILVSEFEHENNTLPWRYLERKGVEVRRVEASSDGRILPSAFAARMDGRTRALAVGWVVYGNGYRSDIKGLSALCRQNNARLIVDGVQGVGVIAQPVDELGADALVCGGHKALFSLAGAGFMYVREDLIKEIAPPYASKFSFESNDRWQTSMALAPDAHRFEYGNPNFLGTWVQRSSAEYLMKLGLPNIEARIRELTTYLIDRAKEAGIRVRTPPAWQDRAAIVSVALPVDTEALAKELRSKKIIVSVKDGHIRASVSFYNNRSDIDRFVEALPRP